MTEHDSLRPAPPSLRSLIDRLARLSAAEIWSDDLTPTQRAALDYLDRANRFSRAPSQVADYLGATRGTVSQTLKTLAQKDLIEEDRSGPDKRRISYDLTPEGRRAVQGRDTLSEAMDALEPAQQAALTEALREVLKAMLEAQGGRAFGLCQDCRHHAKMPAGGAHCQLLNVGLTAEDGGRICHEQVPA